MEKRNDINWETIGLLSGCQGEKREVLEKLLQNIDQKYETNNKELWQYLSPVIRRMIGYVFDMNTRLPVFAIRSNAKDEVIPLINTDDIASELEYLLKELVPICDKCFETEDHLPYIMEIFCKNYLLRLMKK